MQQINPYQTAQTYTPGDAAAHAQQFASSQVPLTAALGQAAATPPVVPVWGVLALVGVLLVLERRRLGLGKL